jgi:peptidoglycan hydrolase-like protein with peptidoglycan-binding domain
VTVYSDPTHVAAVQAAINASGYVDPDTNMPIPVDGKTGRQTAKAVVWFEQLHGLTVDSGIIGDQVMAATIAPSPAQVAYGIVPSTALVPPIVSVRAAVAPTLPKPTLPVPGAPPKLPTPPAPSTLPVWVPPLGGAVLFGMLGAILPLPIVAPLRILLGAIVGGGAGAGIGYALKPATPPAVPPTVAAHGEFGWEPNPFDRNGRPMFPLWRDAQGNYDLDQLYARMLDADNTITAGEIGMAGGGALKG